jgi:hypothetical protein
MTALEVFACGCVLAVALAGFFSWRLSVDERARQKERQNHEQSLEWVFPAADSGYSGKNGKIPNAVSLLGLSQLELDN